jgi:hypothetical protein
VNSKHNAAAETPKAWIEKAVKVYAKIITLGIYGDRHDMRMIVKEHIPGAVIDVKVDDNQNPVFTVTVPENYGMPTAHLKPSEVKAEALAVYQGVALRKAKARVWNYLRLLSESYGLSQENTLEFLTELGYSSVPEETSAVSISIPLCDEYPKGRHIAFRAAGHLETDDIRARAEELAGPLTDFTTKVQEAFPEAQNLDSLKVSVGVGYAFSWPEYKDGSEDEAS